MNFLRYENNNLINENEKLCKGHKALSIEIGKLKIQNQKEDKFCDDELIQELEELKLENVILKSSLNESKETNVKFVLGEKKFKTHTRTTKIHIR